MLHRNGRVSLAVTAQAFWTGHFGRSALEADLGSPDTWHHNLALRVYGRQATDYLPIICRHVPQLIDNETVMSTSSHHPDKIQHGAVRFMPCNKTFLAGKTCCLINLL